MRNRHLPLDGQLWQRPFRPRRIPQLGGKVINLSKHFISSKNTFYVHYFNCRTILLLRFKIKGNRSPTQFLWFIGIHLSLIYFPLIKPEIQGSVIPRKCFILRNSLKISLVANENMREKSQSSESK